MKKATKTPRAEPAPVAGASHPAPAKKAVLPETTEGMPWPSNHEIKKESNPFTDRDWRMWLYAWTGLAVRLVIIFGAIFTVYQFLDQREQRRSQETLGLIELWETADYQDAQIAVRQRLVELNEQYSGLLGANPSAEEMALYQERIGLEAVNGEGGKLPKEQFQQKFDRLVYFLNRLAVCVEGNRCDAEMARTYFHDYAASFWRYFAGYAQTQRKAGAATFAAPIEKFVTGTSPAGIE